MQTWISNKNANGFVIHSEYNKTLKRNQGQW